MSESAFGVAFKELRERRALSLRDLGKLAEIDHAYIHRFETGAKEPPPLDTSERLLRHLKPTPHQAQVMRYLREQNIDPSLARYALDDLDATPEILEIARTAVHRGAARPTPRDLVLRAKRAKEIMDE